MMRGSEAVRQIRNTAFKPGWEYQAVPFHDDLVMVDLFIDTVDTSYPDADGICRRKTRIVGGTKVLDVSGLTETGLCFELLKLALDADEHEDREFLKVRQPDGSWYSPLHPHTPEGNRAWNDHLRKLVRA